MADINKETVKHVAHLARIGMSDEEAEQFLGELAKILGFVEELGKADTDATEPVGHITGMTNASRPDDDSSPVPGIEQDLLAEQAPGFTQDGEVRVPRILES